MIRNSFMSYMKPHSVTVVCGRCKKKSLEITDRYESNDILHVPSQGIPADPGIIRRYYCNQSR